MDYAIKMVELRELNACTKHHTNVKIFMRVSIQSMPTTSMQNLLLRMMPHVFSVIVGRGGHGWVDGW
jgi:hypothetical protein